MTTCQVSITMLLVSCCLAGCEAGVLSKDPGGRPLDGGTVTAADGAAPAPADVGIVADGTTMANPDKEGAPAPDGSAAPAPDVKAVPAPDVKVAPPPKVSANQRPFDPDHPVYHPIPKSCPLYKHSAKIVANIASNYRGFDFDTGAESPAVYVGKASDPIYSLSIHGKTFKVHVPGSAKSGTGSDYPLVILDESSLDYGGIPVEYRMWQAKVSHSGKSVSCNGGGVGCYANDGKPHYKNKLATGHAEIYGQNTGSGESYTVGMIRPVDVKRGRIDHAMRAAIGYPHDKRWFWPATRTEPSQPYSGTGDHRAPMGARIFLDASVDVVAVGNAAAAKLSDAKNKAFARMFIKALQEFGMIALDGTSGSHNIYFEGDATAGWGALIGKKNGYGSYNDIARAVRDAIPWNKLRVADGSVFKGTPKAGAGP